MADGQDDERDDEWFKEVYGREYTGPPRAPRDNLRDNGKVKKRSTGNTSTSAGESDDEDEPRDPNAVPTDFTSREAKVWEAKAKAVERNWKRRKEEELTCRICGEVGHFAQGCPTTLGGNSRKPGEVVERISLRDKRLRPRLIGTGGTVIQSIEKETGCRLKLEDNLTVGNGAFFVKISGPDKMAVGKAADTVNKLVDQVEDEWKQQSSRRPQGSFRSPTVNPLIAAQMQHIAVQRLQHSPSVSSLPGRGEPPSHEEDKRTIEHIASHLEARRHWEAVSGSSQGLNGSGSSPSFSYKEGQGASGAGSVASQFGGKGSGTPALDGASYYHVANQESGSYQGGSANQEQEQDMDLGYEEQPMPQSLEELERRFLQETIDLTKDQNAEEDKENSRHRELMRDIQEQYQQKMTTLRGKHAKQREDYLRHESQLRQQQYQQGGYYQYSSGGAVPSGRSVSNFNGGSYDLRHISAGSDGTSTYDSYKDGLSQLASHSYSRKQGYENSKGYGGNQGYDSPYYGTSHAYQTYG